MVVVTLPLSTDKAARLRGEKALTKIKKQKWNADVENDRNNQMLKAQSLVCGQSERGPLSGSGLHAAG